jgi:L-fuconolactonase
MTIPTSVYKVDSHQHFWRRDRGDYGWLTPDLTPIYKDYMPEHLDNLLASAGINRTVIVQAAPTDAETDFLLNLAEETDFVIGVVGWVDMESPLAIDRLKALSKNPYFKGVRPMIQDIKDPNWMLGKQQQRVFNAVSDLDLCFDALIRPQHINALLSLLQKNPQLKTVVDHAAKPNIASGGFPEWASRMKEIACNTNAHCKISGLITEAGENASYEMLTPYVEFLLKHFTANRLMWGSDWPVINLAKDYGSWASWCQKTFAKLSSLEQNSIWSGTAINFYNL